MTNANHYRAKRKQEAKLAMSKARAILADRAEENGAAYTVDASAFMGNR
jgi:hypothetical protein